MIKMITLLALELEELFVINSQFSSKEESRLFTKEANLTFQNLQNTKEIDKAHKYSQNNLDI